MHAGLGHVLCSAHALPILSQRGARELYGGGQSWLRRQHPFLGRQAWPSTQASARRVHASAATQRNQRIVFLGTPDVAAEVLKQLVHAANQPGALFEVSAVVSQPGKPKGRGNKSQPVPTPVEETASQLGLSDRMMCPASARDEAFLQQLEALKPDLCITAAYGNMLPQRFLDIPRLGTLNIHPSLLPKYRGAAPVQRCLQAGSLHGGVSLAYTVLPCDAGPVLAQETVLLDPNIQAPDLLLDLFRRGAALLLAHLPALLEGKGSKAAARQDETAATHAPKLRKEEAVLDWVQPPQALHNTVRGLAGWPGTLGHFLVQDEASGTTENLELRVVRTLSPSPGDLACYQSLPLTAPWQEVGWTPEGDMLVPCGLSGADGQGSGYADDGTHSQGPAAQQLVGQSKQDVLRVTMVQPPTKRAISARDFRNGLRKKRLLVSWPQQQ